MKRLFLKNLVERVNEENCPVSYEVIAEALKSLDKMGEPELDDLKFKYIRGNLTRKESELIHWMMGNDESLTEDIKIRSKIYSGYQARKKYVKILVEEAKEYEKQGNLSKAIKSLTDALELRTEDEDTKEKICKVQQEIQIRALVTSELRKIIFRASLICTILYVDNQARRVRHMIEDPHLKKRHSLGQDVHISVELPDSDGYLVLLTYDDEDHLNIIFPNKLTDSTFFKASITKDFVVKAVKPFGKHYVKAIWTSKPIFEAQEIDFADYKSKANGIKGYVASIKELASGEWMESTDCFEVV